MNINVPTNVRAVDLRYVNQQRRKQEQKHKNEQKQQEQRNFDIETEVDVDIDIDIDILNDVVAAADTSSFSMWRQSQRGDQYLFTVRGGGETNDDAGEGGTAATVVVVAAENLPAESTSNEKERSESNESTSKQSVVQDTTVENPSSSVLEPEPKVSYDIKNDDVATVTSTVMTNDENKNNDDNAGNKVTITAKGDTSPATTTTATTTAVAQVKAKAVATFDKSKQKTTAFKKQLSETIPKFAQDVNKRFHQASTTFKQRTVHHTKSTIHDLQHLQVMTKQSLKSYMESLKNKKNNLLLGLGKQHSSTDALEAGGDNDGNDRDHKVIIMAAQAHVKNTFGIVKDKWKNASIVASQVLLGTGMTLRQDITIW
eukprot:CAMPEP_0203667576 /NCGR_PEP_ID=MMETSP0090-20130426/4394_1 /ASSEMBLY_ACC=CAM_ASM_001088 /TAXON_ID=426623 /ORGANISM="Chaetoceros affinis, Strain CCMP159" /LENGTH=370 /DNA_ID=CAMNT_0050531779 /DNA_START=497 /DNA_END=1606 /DNA_ORIENTATION=-